MVVIQSAVAEIRREKERRKKDRNHSAKIYWPALLHGAAITTATRNRKHRRAAAKPAACAPNAVNTREQGKEGGRVR